MLAERLTGEAIVILVIGATGTVGTQFVMPSSTSRNSDLQYAFRIRAVRSDYSGNLCGGARRRVPLVPALPAASE